MSSVVSPSKTKVSDQKHHLAQQSYMDTSVVSEELMRVRQQEFEDLYSEIQDSISDEIDRIISSYYENCDLINSSINEVEMEARLRADVSFQNLQGEHIKELIQVEKQYALEVIRAKLRKCPQVEYLKKQAAGLARIGDFRGSHDAEDQAIIEQENEIRHRKANIDKAFDSQRKSVLTRQKSELAILDQKLVDNLQQIAAIRDSQQKMQLQKLKVGIQSILQHSCDSIPIKMNNPKKKVEIMKRLKEFASAKISDICTLEEDPELPSVIDSMNSSLKKIAKYPIHYLNSTNDL